MKNLNREFFMIALLLLADAAAVLLNIVWD
jgi:hypothetical protein